MTDLVIRNVDEDIVQLLRERASRNNRSVEDEHRLILIKEFIRPRRKTLAQVLASMPMVGLDSDFAR